MKLAEWTRRVRFNINRALKYSYNLGKQKGLEQGRQENPVCLCCPYYLNAQKYTAQVAPATPPVTTSGKVQSVRKIAEQTKFKRALNSRPSGTYRDFHNSMHLKKLRLEVLDNGPDTVRMPAVPKQGATTRDLRRLIEDEDADKFLL